jgi:hypothetical protein
MNNDAFRDAAAGRSIIIVLTDHFRGTSQGLRGN